MSVADFVRADRDRQAQWASLRLPRRPAWPDRPSTASRMTLRRLGLLGCLGDVSTHHTSSQPRNLKRETGLLFSAGHPGLSAGTISKSAIKGRARAASTLARRSPIDIKRSMRPFAPIAT